MNLPDSSSKAAVVEAMFDRIAAHYDLMNRLMTFGMDRPWRRRTVAALGLKLPALVLDLACGTGDFCLELAHAGARAVGIDFSAAMLQVARTRVADGSFVRADALRLPIRDRSFDGIVSGFALRNFADLPVALAECFRVLKPGGRMALLETDIPAAPILRMGHRLYFGGIVPLVGRMIDREAYAYLPASSAYLPGEAQLKAIMTGMGFRELGKRRLLGGAVQVITATR
jgi:demethylmenaquinone methyltransferase / 2-methoxy-6-polyprenyl-1,4-benzoquinol methylase